MIVMRVSPKQLRTYLYKLDRLKLGYTEESKNMTSNCAKEYKKLLVRNIMNEKFSGSYPKLDERYEEWKIKHGGMNGFWKLWGDLVNSISIRETPKGNVVEVPRGAMPSRSSSVVKGNVGLTPIWKYAYYGEYGRGQAGFSKRQPARPVFKPSAEEYRLVFLDKRRRDALDKIRRIW